MTEGSRAAAPASGRFVALGSSFAAGPGIAPRAAGSPRRAGRSARNYAHLAAARLGLDLDDVSYSGATIREILHGTDAGRPAQIEAVTASASVVTITGGGNDVGYVPRLVLASLPRVVRAVTSAQRQADAFGNPEQTEQRFADLTANLARIAVEVRRRAPRSRLLFVDYLTILPPDDTTVTGPLPADVADWGRTVARRLSEVTRAAAEGSGSGFVAAGVASLSHHAWSAEPWTRRFSLSLRGGAPYHPNQAGHACRGGPGGHRHRRGQRPGSLTRPPDQLR